MGMITKGMGVIIKGKGNKSWKTKRIDAMNRVGKRPIGGKTQGVGGMPQGVGGMIDDYVEVLSSKAKNKKGFKKEQAKAKAKRDREYKGLPK